MQCKEKQTELQKLSKEDESNKQDKVHCSYVAIEYYAY